MIDQAIYTGHWVAGCPGVRAPGPTPPESSSESPDPDDAYPPYDPSCSYGQESPHGCYSDRYADLDYGDYDGFDACDQEFGYGGDW